MNSYTYILEPGSKKHLCPRCAKKTLVRYINQSKQEYLPSEYGRCDREAKCGYFLNPYQDWYNQPLKSTLTIPPNYAALNKGAPSPFGLTPKDPIYIPHSTLLKTLEPHRYKYNLFIQNLLQNVPFPFNWSDVNRLIDLYQLGTIVEGFRHGAITFPFIDKQMRVRAIQAKQFDQLNHTISTDFLHSIIVRNLNKGNKALPDWLSKYMAQDKKVSCLFGEHLLSKYPNNPVILVEAPKTAVYGTLYYGFPDQASSPLWLATYSLSTLKLDRCAVLMGRTVFLIPDLSENSCAYNLWNEQAKKLTAKIPKTRFEVISFIEQKANSCQRQQGMDIGDFLIDKDWKLFRKPISCGHRQI